MTQKVFNKVKKYLLECTDIQVNMYDSKLFTGHIQEVIEVGEDYFVVRYRPRNCSETDYKLSTTLYRNQIQVIEMWKEFTPIRTRTKRFSYSH